MGLKHATSKVHGDKGQASEWNADHVVDGDVNFNKYQILKLTLENLAAAPPAPEDGQIYYDTVDKIIKVWDGTAWQDATQLREHDHSNAANGGQLDVDNCFSDFVHNHENAAQGANLDLFAVADATTKIRYYSIAPTDFHMEDGTADSSNFGDNYQNEEADADQGRAHVHLPHGAIVTACQCWGSNVGENWYLKRGSNSDGTTNTNMASAAIDSQDTSISNPTIDNQNYNYFVEIHLNQNDQIHGGRITYTITADNQG